jgi:hypothetical protein
LPPGAGAAAAAVCAGFGFFALRANAGAATSRKSKTANIIDKSANRDNLNCKSVDREKLGLGFMEYVVFLLVSADSAARSLHPENSGPSKQRPDVHGE